MLRISKLADYSTAIMAYLAKQIGQSCNAKQIAVATHLTVPTVSKLLKRLTQAGLLIAQRGTNGGYQLAFAAQHISLAKIIAAIDGTIALTDCGDHAQHCELEQHCRTKHSWQIINRTISQALENINLVDMMQVVR